MAILVDGAGTRPYTTLESPPRRDPVETDPVKHEPVAEPKELTPQQKVDQAVASYEAAVKSGDQAAVEKAKQDVYAAVREEIGPQISRANANIPPNYRTPTDKQITSYGNAILNRHPNSQVAQGVIKDAVSDYQLQRKADSLIPQFSGNFTPKEKLVSLQQSLQGQPPEVIERVMQNPSVQQMFKDAANWVAEPYNGVSNERAQYDQQAAAEASKRLADLTSGLPPEWNRQIVRESMPTIQKIAGVDANGSGFGSFTNLSRVVGSLGEGAEAQALTRDIAQAYRGQFEKWEGRFAGRGSSIEFAVGDGASPRLALELATQLKADGKADQAGVILRTVERGVEQLKLKVEKDYEAYAEHTKDLNWLIANSQGKLTPAQLQQAIQKYISGKGADWQNQLREIEGKLTTDARALNEAIGHLEGLRADLKQTAPDAFQSLRQNLGQDKEIQQAIQYAASRDPSIFGGEKSEDSLKFWLEVGNNNKDFTSSLGKAYFAGHLLPSITTLNTADPASVAKANRALDELQEKGAKLLGIPQSEVDQGVSRLRSIVHTLQTTRSTDATVQGIHDLDAVKKDLSALNEIRFSNGFAGVAFRTMAFGISGAGVINGAKATLDDPSLQNVLGTLAFSVGLAQDSAAFGATLKLVDKEGGLGQFGLGTSLAGKAAEKFIGVLNIASFSVGAFEGVQSGNVPLILFNAAGAGGVALGTFGGALGAWAGPVGFGIAVVATAAVELVKYRAEIDKNTEMAEKFFAGAGVDPGVAKALSNEALAQATDVQKQLGLSAEQLQQMAQKYPQVFTGGPSSAQAVIDVAKANGLSGSEVLGFLDAAAKDDPEFVSRFQNQLVGKNGSRPLSFQADMYEFIARDFSNAANYVKQHSPELVGPQADARRQADRDYEYSDRSPETIANLLKGDKSAAYQAEIIKLMKDNGTLDSWVDDIANQFNYNGWPEAAKVGLQAAEKAGVLTHEQAQAYLSKLD